MLTLYPEQAGEIEAKSSADWQAELDQGKEELEMNMATNSNVVEQYKKRQSEVSVQNQHGNDAKIPTHIFYRSRHSLLLSRIARSVSRGSNWASRQRG